MTTPVAPGIVAIETVWEQENQPVENTFHYHVTGTIDATVLQNIAQTYATWANTNKAHFNAACQLVKITGRDLSSANGASLIYNVSPPIIGTNAGTPLPNNVTFALKRETGLRGRANRGRVYFIGLTAGDLQSDQQQIVSGSATTWATMFTTLMTSQFTANGAQEVIYHKALGTGTPVIGYAYADLFVDSQRRRLPGHNRHH
jgi:hypothetical protein